MRTIIAVLRRFCWLVRGLFWNDPASKDGLRFLLKVGPAFLGNKGPKILFERHSGLGDVICTFPAVIALRNEYPHAVIVYAVKDAFAPVVEFSGVADAVFPMRREAWITEGWYARLFDHVYRPALANEVGRGVNSIHLVDDLCAQVGVRPDERQPRINVPHELRQKLGGMLANASKGAKLRIAVHTGPSWGVREWTEDGWRRLGEWLVCEQGASLFQLGADEHFGMGSIKAVRVPGATDWVGKLSLSDTVACIQACDLFVGIDSGLLHVAGAVGTPSVGIFGPTLPELRMPPATLGEGLVAPVPCLGCHHRDPILHWRLSCPNEIICMKCLHIDQVKEACLRLFSQREVHA